MSGRQVQNQGVNKDGNSYKAYSDGAYTYTNTSELITSAKRSLILRRIFSILYFRDICYCVKWGVLDVGVSSWK